MFRLFDPLIPGTLLVTVALLSAVPAPALGNPLPRETAIAIDQGSFLDHAVSGQPPESRNASQNTAIAALAPGQPIERELKGGQKESYHLVMQAGQCATVIVEQRGIDVRVRLYGVDEKVIAEIDHESRNQGIERVKVVASDGGDYMIEIEPTLRCAAAARYEVRLDELRSATEADRIEFEASRLVWEAERLSRDDDGDKAIPLATKALHMVEQTRGHDSAEYVRSLNLFAACAVAFEDFPKAEAFCRQALEISERLPAAENPDLAASLLNTGTLYRSKGDLTTARSFIRRALEMRERLLDTNHFLIGLALLEYGRLLVNEQDYPQAEEEYRRAAANIAKSIDEDSKEYATVLHYMGILYDTTGDFSRALEVYRRELAATERSWGKDSPRVALVLDYLARIYCSRGQYDEAEQAYRRNLDIREKFSSEYSILASLGNLGYVRYARGDYQGSEDIYKQVLERRKKTGADDPSWMARNLMSLGEINNSKGDYAAAEEYLKRSLSFIEKEPSIDRRLRYQADTWTILAGTYIGKGDYTAAEELTRRALALYEQKRGQSHPVVASALNRLGRMAYLKSDLTGAEPLYQRALAIFESSEGAGSPDTLEPLNNLADLYGERGDTARALAFQARANAVDERKLALALATGGEHQKLAYIAASASQMDRTLAFNIQKAPHDPKSSEAAAMAVLRFKGRVLDAMTDTIAALRRHATPEDVMLLDQLSQTTERLANTVLSRSGNMLSERDLAEIAALEQKKAELEDRMSRRTAGAYLSTTPVTLAPLREAIPADAALIEFAAYRPFDPKARDDGKAYGEPRYVAYVLRRQGEVGWADIGPVKEVDARVDALRQALANPERRDVRQLARAVDGKVFQSVRALSGAATRLLVSPDGELNLIPFEALVDEHGKYLIERYSFSYLTSGRDLLRLEARSESKGPPVIIADPAFGGPALIASSGSAASKHSPGPRSTQRVDYSQIFFEPLPGVIGEVRVLKELMPQAAFFTKDKATKAALRDLSGPSILHLATHGFFLKDEQQPIEDKRAADQAKDGTRLGKMVAHVGNPLLRSGLALAGANQSSSGNTDGILTALEVAGLDLRGTKLVVLSACDTGVGEVRNGDGVYGLRRAFVLAGAETQVMSLWPVSDRGTRDLIIDFYKGLLRGGGRGEALRQAQLSMLKTKPHPYYWAGFIQAGEWANLEGKR